VKTVLYTCAAAALALCLAAPASVSAQAAKAKGGAARTITMEGTDTLRFTPAAIRAKRGETIRLVLTTKSMMPKAAMAHNFVLLKPDTDQMAFATAAARARTTEYIPAAQKDAIIAYTGLAGAGETVEVTFKVPDTAGAYPFICTFPAHFQGGMKGTLTVE
jgi:azurin